jgi:hypothetical protein
MLRNPHPRAATQGTDDMIRIEVTAAAYQAIAAGVRNPIEAQASPSGGFYLWLDRLTLNRLMHARGHGEDYSDTILRLAAA